ncbi:hypothetical protein CSUI_001768, partial [Cystoisospora suis]
LLALIGPQYGTAATAGGPAAASSAAPQTLGGTTTASLPPLNPNNTNPNARTQAPSLGLTSGHLSTTDLQLLHQQQQQQAAAGGIGLLPGYGGGGGGGGATPGVVGADMSTYMVGMNSQQQSSQAGNVVSSPSHSHLHLHPHQPPPSSLQGAPTMMMREQQQQPPLSQPQQQHQPLYFQAQKTQVSDASDGQQRGPRGDMISSTPAQQHGLVMTQGGAGQTTVRQQANALQTPQQGGGVGANLVTPSNLSLPASVGTSLSTPPATAGIGTAPSAPTGVGGGNSVTNSSSSSFSQGTTGAGGGVGSSLSNSSTASWMQQLSNMAAFLGGKK